MVGSQSILLTGGSGFIGRAFIQRWLEQHQGELKLLVRNPLRDVPKGVTVVKVDSLSCRESELPVFGVDVVVHCAARAHIMKDGVDDPLEAYREVNTLGTLNLARQAAAAGVRRFIFVSSIKVNGEQTPVGGCFTERDMPAPRDAYGVSKWEAEEGLRDIGANTGMDVVIIRPPLVYGAGVKGNFANMISLVRKGMPLPFGAIHNKRSLVALDNLIDLIFTCITHSNAANQTFLVSDGEDISTTQLLKGLAEAMRMPSRLIPIPATFLKYTAVLLGKGIVAQKLLGSLQVDISHTRESLNWAPPLTVKQGLKRCFQENGN